VSANGARQIGRAPTTIRMLLHKVLDMATWSRIVKRIALRESGQDLLEYALLVALIAVVAVGAVTRVGSIITTVFWDAIAANT
jgi:Flp pilus assembly pilin Flp